MKTLDIVKMECNGLRRCDIEALAVEVLRDQPAERCAAMREILKQIRLLKPLEVWNNS